jgi:glycogen debranching enzyme
MSLTQVDLERDINELRSDVGYLYAGKPHYTTLFGRDALISAWQMLTHDPSISRATLSELARYQGSEYNPLAEEQPGKILHMLEATPSPREAIPDWPLPYYGTVDATPLFIFLAGQYLETTGDRGFIRSIWPNLVRACRWMISDGDVDGDLFLEYERHNPNALFHQSWRDSEEDHLGFGTPPIAIVEAQGYQYAALSAMRQLARSLQGESELPGDLDTRMSQLRERFDQSFWWPDEAYYVLGLDGQKGQHRSVTSNPGHLLFTGIVPAAREPHLVARLMKPDLLTEFGVRTQSMSDRLFDDHSYHMGSIWPHDNWIIWKGLRSAGFTAEAAEIRERVLDAISALGYAPELYGVTSGGDLIELNQPGPDGEELANRLQAWSSAAALDMLLTG